MGLDMDYDTLVGKKVRCVHSGLIFTLREIACKTKNNEILVYCGHVSAEAKPTDHCDWQTTEIEAV